MEIVPITQAEAKEFVAQHHRHNSPPVGDVFRLAVAQKGTVHGVAIVGRPVARHMCDGWTLEVTRCCTDGARNACSMLYGAAWRAAKALGYRRLITYTRDGEPGTSLRAAGWVVVAEVKGRSWSCLSRPRVENPRQDKLRWEKSDT